MGSVTVGYMESLSPTRRERLFEAWIKLRRRPDGAAYESTAVAAAMVLRVTFRDDSAETEFSTGSARHWNTESTHGGPSHHGPRH